MEPYQERVLEEKRELDARAVKLQAFIQNDPDSPNVFDRLPKGEQSRMRIQLAIMEAYSTVLGERFAHFGTKQ